MSVHPVISKTPRGIIAQRLLVGAGLAGAALGVLIALADKLNLAAPAPVLALAAAAAMAALAWVSVVYWRHLDEAAREAHKFAWLWGGTGGLLLLPPAAALLSSSALVAGFGAQSPLAWVFGGVIAVLTMQILGYGAVWAGWWLIRQR